jgi:deazaflavin-dependent oxidoreductase (nitroreductase family)
MPPDSLRRVFWFLNRYFMVPLFRMGLGAWVGNPLSGYIMVVKTVGRKSGKTRYSPVNYALDHGFVYCMAGWGRASDWYRNMLANPQIGLILPGGGVTGTAETVTDPEERRVLLRKILRGAGFAGFFEGFNPFTVTDAQLVQRLQAVPLVKIRLSGLESGAADPGGWLWVLVWGAFFALILRKGNLKRR